MITTVAMGAGGNAVVMIMGVWSLGQRQSHDHEEVVATKRQYDAVMAGLARTRRVTAPMALACVMAVAAGCTSSPAGSPAHSASPGPASPAPVPTALATGAQRQALAAKYLVIAKTGNHRLDIELGHLEGRDRRNLAAAHRDLRAVAATERAFDRQLLTIAFPPATERFARFLYWVNQARASLTAKAVCASSLPQLRRYERRMAQANKPVEQAVAIIRSQLGLPPPETS